MPSARQARAAPRRDHLRFGLVLAALLALVLFTPRAPVLRGILVPLDFLTAEATAILLQAGGMEVARAGAVLSHPSGFAYEIYWRCTGLLPAVFLAGLILASPGRARRKVVGVAAGVAIVLAVNLVRLAHLFSVGVRYPAAFQVTHSVIWESGTVVLVLGLWLAWTRGSASE